MCCRWHSNLFVEAEGSFKSCLVDIVWVYWNLIESICKDTHREVIGVEMRQLDLGELTH